MLPVPGRMVNAALRAQDERRPASPASRSRLDITMDDAAHMRRAQRTADLVPLRSASCRGIRPLITRDQSLGRRVALDELHEKE